jgi:hypothetical protein
MVPENINGSYSTYATFPITDLYPSHNLVSFINEYKSVDLPDPTFPITNNKSPFRNSIFMSLKHYSLVCYFHLKDAFCIEIYISLVSSVRFKLSYSS